MTDDTGTTVATTTTKAKSVQTEVTFWERVATLGVKGVLTVGVVSAWTIMLFTGVTPPKEYVWFVFAMSGWLGIGEVLKGITKLGK